MDAELRKLERLLYGYNYQVFLRSYSAKHAHDADVEAIVMAALGEEATVDEIHTESTEKTVATIKSRLEYRGDESSGPLPKRIDSPKFCFLRDAVLNHVRELCWSSVSVTGLCIGDGHPAYPVFWDFAYLFRGGESSTVFIGSSSD
ncbi:MAG: hypothetical protein KDB27_31220 [Planctomycetales bacterium]|nr:hypothetical protein [Planctomycetales bacterium]